MRLTRLFKASLAITCLAVAWPALTTGGTSLVPAASAAVEVEIGNDQFYDELAPYGDWVWYKGGYVFVPGDVDDRWRPYAVGRWAYTDDYGWLWVSDEPFGWATYHYGRWGYGDDLGWYWVPGRVWAPAWVSWRRGSDYVVWAPLPPTYGDNYYDGEDDEDYEVADNDIPDNYWNAVPAVSFLAANLAAFIYADDDEDYGYHRRRYIDETESLGPVRYRNRMVLNNGLDARFIEKETNQKVRRYKVRETDDWRGAGKRNGDEIQIYDRKVKYRPDAKPMRVKNVEQVEQKHGQRWKKGKGSDQNQDLSGKKPVSDTKKQQGLDQDQNGVGQSKNRNGLRTKDEPGQGKDKKKSKRYQDQATETGKPGKKQKNRGDQQQNTLQNGQPSDGQSLDRKKKRRQDQELNGDSSNRKKKNQDAEFSGQENKKNKRQDSEFSGQEGKKKKRNQSSDELSGGGKQKNRKAGSGDQQEGGGKKRRNDASGQDDQSGNSKKRKSQGACDPNSGENC